MELIQIKVIGPQTFQGAAQLGLGAGPVALLRLAGQEVLISIRLERGAETYLCVAIGRRDVKVIDAPLDGLGDRFGQAVVNGNAILDDLNPRMPQLRRDTQLIADLGDTYSTQASSRSATKLPMTMARQIMVKKVTAR